MGLKLIYKSLAIAVIVAFSACGGENQAGSVTGEAERTFKKGGDDRTGPYEVVGGFWKAAPDHTDEWGWGSVSGVATDTPDRIIVGIWGDQNVQREDRPGGSNFLVVVDHPRSVYRPRYPNPVPAGRGTSRSHQRQPSIPSKFR